MSINSFNSNKKYWFDPKARVRQSAEVKRSLMLLEHLVEEDIKSGNSERDLRELLYEYISNANRFLKIMKELNTEGTRVNEETGEEQHLLNNEQTKTIRSTARHLVANDWELLRNWGINLTIH
jgi:DNA replicative helicase MCM subunit Mcm2 (Cdc46/Mcm family)